jgi:hypothetical protein
MSVASIAVNGPALQANGRVRDRQCIRPLIAFDKGDVVGVGDAVSPPVISSKLGYLAIFDATAGSRSGLRLIPDPADCSITNASHRRHVIANSDVK